MKEIADREVSGTLETTETEERVPDTLRSNHNDDLVRRACNGDAWAVRKIEELIGPRMVREARDALGPSYDYEAKDVLLRLYRRMLERKWPPVPPGGDAIRWLCKVIAARARERRLVRELRRLDREDDER
jgi:hypothetical protein